MESEGLDPIFHFKANSSAVLMLSMDRLLGQKWHKANMPISSSSY